MMEMPINWRKYWRVIAEPAPSVQGEERQQVLVLATLAASLLLIAPGVLVIWALTSPSFLAAPMIGLAIFASLVVVYALSRTRHHRAGAYLLISMLMAIVAVTVAISPGSMSQRLLVLKFLVVAILVSIILLPLWATVVVSGLCISGTLSFAALAEVPFADIYSYLVFEGVMSALLIIATALRNQQVAERQQAEAALRQSEDRFRRLALQSPDTIYILSLASREIEFVNREDFLGYSLSELLQPGTLIGAVAPEDYAQVASSWDDLRAGRGSGVTVVDYRIRHKSGAWEWVQQRGTILSYAPGGTPAQILVVLTVITERKRVEEQVLQAQKMEAIGQLAGGIAHDFNNLLTVMNGYADFLLSTLGADDPARKDVAEIAGAGARAAALTRQLLTFSRQSPREVARVSLNMIVSEAETMLRRVIGEEIALEVRLSPVDWHVQANSDQIGQALLNLVVNARDAMPRGGALTIATSLVELDAESGYARAHPGIAPGLYVALDVSDTGVGMAPQVQAHVFEPFFTTKGPGGGTGLGLAVVHGIVSQSDGLIEIASELGRGTTFRIYLPALGPDVIAPPVGPELPPSPGDETVLLVEDDAAVRQMALRSLEYRGYRVLATPGSAEALALAESYAGQIDLVLTDVVMPGRSGPELVALLRRVRPRLRAIYMSGYAADATLRHGTIEGADAFISKPFTSDTLARRVREALDA